MPNRCDPGGLNFTALTQSLRKPHLKPSIFFLVHTSFSLLLCNYLLSGSVIVLFRAAMQTLLLGGKKCLFAQLDSPVWGIKDVGLLELLIHSSLCSILLNMKIAKKQSMQEVYGWMLLQLHVPADGWCPLNVWEHSLAHCHDRRFQRSWQHPALPNSKPPTLAHPLFNCFS